MKCNSCKKNLFSIVVAIILATTISSCTAQGQVDYSLDSMRVANCEWRVDSIADGVTLKRYHFGEGALFCSAQYFMMVEISSTSPHVLHFVADSTAHPVSYFAQNNDALVAINGSYFDMSTGWPICFLRIDGNTFGENIPNVGDSINRKYYQYAVIALEEGRIRLLTPDSNRRWEDSLSYNDIMTAGPMLLHENKIVEQRTDRTFVTSRHNRTAMGVRDDGTIVIFLADGRFRHKAEGLSLSELSMVMHWLGCTDAINLDGGGSSTLYTASFGVVNYPSDNKKYDHDGERYVSNAIIIK